MVLKSSPRTIDADSVAKITSVAGQYFTRRIVPLLPSTRQRQNDISGRNMEPTSSTIGLIVIAALYVFIGVMSAAGSVYISRSIFSAKVEQIFFALFLIPIAGFYLAFTAYFRDQDAWQVRSDCGGSVCCFRPSGSPSSICCHNRIPATYPMGRGP